MGALREGFESPMVASGKRGSNAPRNLSACLRRVRHALRRALGHAARGVALSRQGRGALAGVALEAARVHVAARADGRATRTSAASPSPASTGPPSTSALEADDAARRALIDEYRAPRALSRSARRARRAGARPAARDPLQRPSRHARGGGRARQAAQLLPRRRAERARGQDLQARTRPSTGSSRTELGVPRSMVGFVSSNGWDAAGRARLRLPGVLGEPLRCAGGAPGRAARRDRRT